jgi:hypothetical protein
MISCRRARPLIVEHLRGQVGEVALLQLDQHLAACAECRRERARWETVGALKEWQPPSLSGAARARIVERLAAARPARAPARRVAARPSLLMGALAAAAALALLWGGARRPHSPSMTSGRQTWDQPGTLEFAGAQLDYRAGTVAELRPAARAVTLERGELEVAASTAPLEITTPAYKVSVRAAHAVFAANSVHVLEGAVIVYTFDERVLATLSAGERWPAPPSAPVAIFTGPTRATAALPLAMPSLTAPPPEAPPSPAVALGRARAALAAGDARQARRWIERALAQASSPRDRAEAELFGAESYLVEQQPVRAVAAYRRVAAAYARLPEGEAAAFAAAQVLSEKGASAEAAGALRAYLARYPDGRFAREAKDRLAEALPPGR